MAEKKYTPKQITDNPDLRRKVCSGGPKKPTSNKKSSGTGVGEMVESAADTFCKILSMGIPPRRKK